MPVTPAPSYTPSHNSSSSKKHKSSSTEKDKEKDRDRDRDRDKDKDKDKDRDAKTRDGFDDVFSVKSRSTNSSSATDSSTTSTIDTLRLISGNGVRRSKCRADFVEELAKGPALAALGKVIAENLKIITGKEGITFFRKFIQEEPFEVGLKNEEQMRELLKRLSNPVVFAVRVVDAGRKVLDYYMTWRGKTARAKDLKGSERRTSLLDDEFRRVARTIDKEYKRATHDDSRSHKSTKSKRHHSSPSIIVSPPEPVLDASSPATPTTNRTSSANDSVISLPFLGTIRNVPISNRLPLRVTNPDRNSVAGSSLCESPTAQVAPNNTSLETLVEATETVESAPGDPERQASVDTLVQASDADQKLAPKKEKRRKSYAESISSTGSRSSRSSRRSHRRQDRSRSRKSSPVRKHHESSSRSKSERKGHGHSSSSRHKDGGEDGGHSTRKRHSTRHRDEKREVDDDDKSSHKSSRKGTSHSEKPLESNYTLVILDPEEVDRVSVREATKHVKKETLTRSGSAWHKVAAPRRSTKPSPSTVTPWTGPLARESDGVRNINPQTAHTYNSDESDEWIDVTRIVSKSGSFVSSPPSSDYSSDDDPLSPSPPPVDDHHPHDFSPNAYHQHLSPLPANAYGPPLPVNPYRHASPHVIPYHLSSPPPPTIPFGFMSPAPSVHTPGLIPSSIFSPAGSNAGLHPYHTPGFIPSPYNSPNHSLHHTATLPSIHSISDSVSATNHVAAMTHGSASPYLYSTPRPLHSPYVPAWISPASSANVSLPGSLTPTSTRGAVLQTSGYAPSSGGGSAY